MCSWFDKTFLFITLANTLLIIEASATNFYIEFLDWWRHQSCQHIPWEFAWCTPWRWFRLPCRPNVVKELIFRLDVAKSRLVLFLECLELFHWWSTFIVFFMQLKSLLNYKLFPFILNFRKTCYFLLVKFNQIVKSYKL